MCGPWTMVALCAGALNVLLTTALFLSWRTFQNRMITFNAPWARAICVVATEFVSKWINSNVRVNRVRHWCRAIVSSMDLQQIGHHNEHTLHTQLTHRTMSPSTRRGRIQCVIHFRYSIARRDRQSKHNRQIITLKEARVVTRVRHCAKNKARKINRSIVRRNINVWWILVNIGWRHPNPKYKSLFGNGCIKVLFISDKTSTNCEIINT